MKALKVLELLQANKIEELRRQLEDEVYIDTLNAKSGEKKRYTAMKRYFTYVNQTREVLRKPCVVEFEDKQYTSFTNSWSLILTKEPTGEIELFDTANGKYPDVARLLRFDGLKKKIDFNKVLAEAKAKGYRRTKAEVNHGFKYLMYYDDTYYKIGLVDITYAIIDNDEVAMTYHPYGEKMPLTIQNDIGIAVIMPVKFVKDPEEDEYIIIKVE